VRVALNVVNAFILYGEKKDFVDKDVPSARNLKKINYCMAGKPPGLIFRYRIVVFR